MKPRLILGSSSPRRLELLSPYFDIKVIPPEIDESVQKSESPRAYVKRMAQEKWLSLFGHGEGVQPLLAADTTVVMGSKIFGKAESADEAREILGRFSGRSHDVISAVCVGASIGERPKSSTRVVRTKIQFRKLMDEELESYIRSREWEGKAGAYGIQGYASRFIDRIEGSLTNVIGLPLRESLQLLGVR